MRRRLLLTLLLIPIAFSGCHFGEAVDQARERHDAEKLASAVERLILAIPGATAGNPGSIVQGGTSLGEILGIVGSFIATAVAGGAAGHLSGVRKGRRTALARPGGSK